MQHKPLAGQDTVQHNAQYDSTALHGLLNGQGCFSIRAQFCVYNLSLVPVSYTHLTLPTTPYV